MVRPGKEYIEWVDFEMKLKIAGLDEHSFIRELKLGLYTTKEWKRSRCVPYWAGQYLTIRALVGEDRAKPKVPRSFIFAQMTEQDLKVWEAGEREGHTDFSQAVFEKAKAKAVVLYGDNFEEPTGLIS